MTLKQLFIAVSVVLFIGIVGMVFLVLGDRQSINELQSLENANEQIQPVRSKTQDTSTSRQTIVEDNLVIDNSKKVFSDSQLGVIFKYPKDFSPVIITTTQADKGKMLNGQLIGENPPITIFVGGTTPVIEFPGELNANEISHYPTTQELQNLTNRGYRNEKKINSQGEEYILIYGQHEVDMPYISENQAVAIFKLNSSQDFAAIGFMLVSGNMTTFLNIMDSVIVN